MEKLLYHHLRKMVMREKTDQRVVTVISGGVHGMNALLHNLHIQRSHGLRQNSGGSTLISVASGSVRRRDEECKSKGKRHDFTREKRVYSVHTCFIQNILLLVKSSLGIV